MGMLEFSEPMLLEPTNHVLLFPERQTQTTFASFIALTTTATPQHWQCSPNGRYSNTQGTQLITL